jgi:peptidoglycan/xylan/chitin deacetylase (PgdA/CDA1 family)
MRVRALAEALQDVLPGAREGIAVLAYHLVGAGTDSPVDISAADFRRQMQWLRAECRVVSLESALVSSSPLESGRKPLVVLTFDDAYSNFRSVAWPTLKELELPVTLYAPVAFVDGSGASPIRGATPPPCTWSELKALVGEGVAIGSHTVSHVNLVRTDGDAVDRELRDSRTELEQRLGVPVASFCYPQGKWTREVRRRVRGVYDSAVVAGGRRFIPRRDDKHSIPRLPVRRDLGSFERLVHARLWLSEALADAVRQHVP